MRIPAPAALVHILARHEARRRSTSPKGRERDLARAPAGTMEVPSEHLLRPAPTRGNRRSRRSARGSVSLGTWSRAVLGAAPCGRAKEARAQFCSRQNCLVADKTNLTGSNLDRRRRPVGRGPGRVRVKVPRVIYRRVSDSLLEEGFWAHIPGSALPGPAHYI